MWCAMLPRWCGTRSTAWTTSCSRNARWSRPRRFVRSEWVPGAKAVFEKFADYLPRQEPNSWLAGGKSMSLERIEWIVIPDAATASSALQNGEIDWWETPIADLVPVLKKSRN